MINGAVLGLAFTAGLVATINPCGFAMLPAYISYFMGADSNEPRTRAAALSRGIVVGGVVSLGFIVVFGLAGLLLTLGLQSLTDVLPWLALVIGAGLVILGAAMIRGFYLNVRLPCFTSNKERSLRSLFLFGVSYAIASLSCTLPVFLSLVPATLSQETLFGGVLTFLVYGLGMSTVLIFLTLALSLGRTSIVKWMRSSARYINTVSGVILVIAGVFIIWYWLTILSSGAAEAGSNGLVRWIDELSSSLTQFVADNTRIVIATLVGTIGFTGLYIGGKRALARAEAPQELVSSDS
jgi:cytochrome c biogenesis protein CcdA